MPLADLSYRNTDIKIRLVDFVQRFQKLTQLYAECQPCKKKAMELGIQLSDAEAAGSSREDFNRVDALLDLKIAIRGVLGDINSIKNELENIEKHISEEIKRWQ